MSKIHELAFNAEEIDELLDSVDKKTIYQDVTQSEHGLMSTTDKTKLDALPTAQQIGGALNAKVDKEAGKGLSKNDYTDADKAKVASALQTEIDPTVPSWAKQQTKPSYNYSEIGNTPDLSSFITKSVNDLANYYLKSETYTKLEVAALIGAIQQFHYEIYANLPQKGEGDVLYLIGPTGTGSDRYEEYVYSNNSFTKIGDTSIDLSGYVTTQALNTALADYLKDVVVNVTYSELVELRDDGELVPGTWYRITDYHTTVSPLITDVRSADHQFDVIVRADDASHLNENGYAAHHEGDEYFAACKLEAWELQYRLDNDNWSRVAGTFIEDDNDGYHMRKLGTVEVDGETYILWDASEYTEDYEITRAVSEDEEVGTELKGYDPETGEILDEGWTSSIASKAEVEADGQGTILMLKDEYGNQCPYDFKSIQFKRWAVTDSQQERQGLNGNYMGVLNYVPQNLSIEDETDFIWAYTFSSDATGSEDQVDFSLDGTHNVYGNVLEMAPNAINGLNDVVFYGEYNYSNHLGFDCYCNTFGNSCVWNSFGNNCNSNSFGNSCFQNTFGNGCNQNSFGNNCYSNSFGNGCQSNSFGNSCGGNSFGNDCYNNSFGNDCRQNSFGNYCNNNSFGNSCTQNSFGNNCNSNSFGNYFQSNTFGNNCQYNSFGNYCQSITVFDSVMNCSVTGGSSGSAPVKNAQILNGTAGASAQNKLTISFTANKAYTQVAAKDTNGVLKIWNVADNADMTNYVQKSQTAGLLKNDGTVDTNTYLTQHQDISGKADKVFVASSMPVGGFLPNTLYNLGTLSGNTTFTLATPTDNTIANHYYWTFDTPSTAPTITWPQGITWVDGSAPTISASKHYEVSVLNGIAVAMEV